MERIIRYGNCIILLLIFFQTYAQRITPLTTVKIPGTIGCVSSDPYLFVYLTDDKGNLYKIDSLGKQFTLSSPPRRGPITSVEAYRNVNIFVFYREYQVYYYFDRFLNQSQSLEFNDDKIGFVRIATPSLDQNVWIIDDQDFNLKKYNTTYLTIDLNINLDLIIDPEQYDMNFIREYQNLLFVNDANSGVLIFDNMGNYKTRIPVLGLTNISFYGNDLVYMKDGCLYMINVYTYKERKICKDEFKNATAAIITDNRLYFTMKDVLFIYYYEGVK